MNLQSSSPQALPEAFFDFSPQAPGLHPALATVLDDTAGEALFNLPDFADAGKAEMCNKKGDRRPLHRDRQRGRRERAIRERTSEVINGSKPAPNVNYPHGPAPYKYPHPLPLPHQPFAGEEN